MTTVRLPVHIEERLQNVSLQQNKSKSDVIKEALELFFQKETVEMDSYELGLPYFGKYGYGTSSKDYKKLVKEKIRAKHNSH